MRSKENVIVDKEKKKTHTPVVFDRAAGRKTNKVDESKTKI